MCEVFSSFLAAERQEDACLQSGIWGGRLCGRALSDTMHMPIARYVAVSRVQAFLSAVCMPAVRHVSLRAGCCRHISAQRSCLQSQMRSWGQPVR